MAGSATPRRARHIDTAVADALVTDHVGRMLVWVFVPAAAAAVAATGFALFGQRPIRLAESGSSGGRGAVGRRQTSGPT